MLATACSVIVQFVDGYQYASKCIVFALLMMMCVGFGGYQANVILFGLDQLQDASTDEITSFIIWYFRTYSSGAVVINVMNGYLSENYQILVQLLVYFCISIAVSVSYFDSIILLKEPVTQNPFKLIHKVIRYAINNKYPAYRSAFTYCEDELPSRIDFGKSKYGGPFTTEQVEDVKTFFRILVGIFIFSPLLGGIVTLNQVEILFVKVLKHSNHADIPNNINYYYKANSRRLWVLHWSCTNTTL